MYKLKTPIIHANDERIPTIKKLFAEIGDNLYTVVTID